jgi:hypothetical protein
LKKEIPNPNGIGGKSGKIVRGQNDPQQKTADRLAQEHGVSGRTIKRDGKVAEFLEQHPEAAKAVLHGGKKLADVRREIKREHKGNQYLERGQNDPIPERTADRLAKEHGVSAGTIKRD